MGEEADPVHSVMRQPSSRQCWTTFWHHKAELFLEPELDVGQLLTLLEQFHLNILQKFSNLYVNM